jgi:hypothetical protein
MRARMPAGLLMAAGAAFWGGDSPGEPGASGGRERLQTGGVWGPEVFARVWRMEGTGPLHGQGFRWRDASAGARAFAARRERHLHCLRSPRENPRGYMQLNIPPDLEMLINKRLSSGGYASVEDVLRRALEAQDAEESWTDE